MLMSTSSWGEITKAKAIWNDSEQNEKGISPDVEFVN